MRMDNSINKLYGHGQYLLDLFNSMWPVQCTPLICGHWRIIIVPRTISNPAPCHIVSEINTHFAMK